MKICTVIGARPQFVKAAAVSSAIAEIPSIEEIIIHTGQHYDTEMSDIFFTELKIPKEKYNLNVGSGTHGEQTAKMLTEIEKVLLIEKPDWVMIYGDTNSTVAGALAAVKLHIPVAHIEAGMRSFNRAMPEEINRVVSDHISEINFCSTATAVENLKIEGRSHTAMLVGDVMYDIALKTIKPAEKNCNPFEKYSVRKDSYILMTCHRAENTDSRERMTNIVRAVNETAGEIQVILPIHPRTKKFLQKYDLSFNQNVKLLPPVSYLEMILLEKYARLILTDSGGVQKEAFFYGVPCVTMRDETEWVETCKNGWNILCGADYKKILASISSFLKQKPDASKEMPYGDGKSSEKILKVLLERSTHV